MFVLLGANHKSAPVAVRERLAIGAASIGETLEFLRSSDGVSEAMVLSTCNRVEILVWAAGRRPGAEAIRRFLIEARGLTEHEIERYTYMMHGDEAVRHLFHVAAGLDSMILGEPQILGQIRNAWMTAREHEATGRQLDRMMQQCLFAARRARHETGISRHAVSVAYAAAQLGRNIFGDLKGRRALLIGAGKMSSLVAKHLRAQGLGEIIVASRTYDRAMAMAERVGGRALHWDDGMAQLSKVDVVVSCTDSSHHVLMRDDVAKALRQRRGEPLFLIDIAVPRDIDPAVHNLGNAYLYDIDGLQGVVDANLEERRKAAAAAETVLEEETAQYFRWRRTQRVAPLIVALREAMHELGDSEVQRVSRKHSVEDPTQRKALEQLARGLVQKMLHRPIRHLQQAAVRGDIEPSAVLFSEIFDIDPGDIVEPELSAAAADETTKKSDDLGPRRIVSGGKDG